MPAKAPPRPRTKPFEQRRDDLMNAAQALFLEQGIEPTTIDQITSSADVAKGTFYLYFESKEDVLQALRKRYESHFLAAVDAAMQRQREDDWPGKLLAWVKTAVSVYVDSVPLHDLIFHQGHCRRREKLRNSIAMKHLTATLAAGASARAWSIERPQEVAVFLSYGLHGIIDLALIGDKPASKRQLVQSAVQLTARIVGIEPA
jgi:AcrR family transcriptional regulator